MRLVHLFLSLLFCLPAAAVQQWQGVMAPEFRLEDQHGQMHELKDYRGRWLILYFYPKDKTPGCSKEAANFRDRAEALGKLNAAVVGVSLDGKASHKDFADTLRLPFALLSDSGKQAAKAYDVLFELGPVSYTERQTFLIDPAGRIARHYPKVNPDTHADEVLSALTELQSTAP